MVYGNPDVHNDREEAGFLRVVAYVNGHYVDLDKAVVPVEDRSCQFADGVYEVSRFIGRRPVRLGEHLQRLEESCALLGIKGAPAAEDWRRIIARLLDDSGIPHDDAFETILYQQVSRGAAPRSHLFPPASTPPSCVAYFRIKPAYTAKQRSGGVALISQPDERWNRCNIKSVCLLPSVLAKQAAHDAGGFEALLVRDGIVTEGSSTNAFCVRGGKILTHPDGPRILSGVTRGLAFDAAALAGIEVVLQPVTFQEYIAADEAFLTSTTMNVMPVTSVDGKPIATGAVGPVTSRLAAAVDDLMWRELRANREFTCAGEP